MHSAATKLKELSQTLGMGTPTGRIDVLELVCVSLLDCGTTHQSYLGAHQEHDARDCPVAAFGLLLTNLLGHFAQCGASMVVDPRPLRRVHLLCSASWKFHQEMVHDEGDQRVMHRQREHMQGGCRKDDHVRIRCQVLFRAKAWKHASID